MNGAQTLDDLQNLEESYILQKKFNLKNNPTSWFVQFLLELFDMFFLPLLILIFFMLFTAPWFTSWFSKYVPDEFVRYLCVSLLFLAITFYLTRTYIVIILNN